MNILIENNDPPLSMGDLREQPVEVFDVLIVAPDSGFIGVDERDRLVEFFLAATGDGHDRAFLTNKLRGRNAQYCCCRRVTTATFPASLVIVCSLI